jgi:hypothetical protein
MHLLAERFVFWGGPLGFLKEQVNTYFMVAMLPLDTPAFFCLHVYGLCSPEVLSFHGFILHFRI